MFGGNVRALPGYSATATSPAGRVVLAVVLMAPALSEVRMRLYNVTNFPTYSQRTLLKNTMPGTARPGQKKAARASVSFFPPSLLADTYSIPACKMA